MLWLIDGDTSYLIAGCNVHSVSPNTHQVWIERMSGKTLCIRTYNDQDHAETLKNAIDYAIKTNEKVLEI